MHVDSKRAAVTLVSLQQILILVEASYPSLLLTGVLLPFVSVLMATAAQVWIFQRGGSAGRVRGISSPSGKNLLFSDTPLSWSHIQGMLLAFSSCVCIWIISKLKKKILWGLIFGFLSAFCFLIRKEDKSLLLLGVISVPEVTFPEWRSEVNGFFKVVISTLENSWKWVLFWEVGFFLTNALIVQ